MEIQHILTIRNGAAIFQTLDEAERQHFAPGSPSDDQG
jgi:hypothetical protein